MAQGGSTSFAGADLIDIGTTNPINGVSAFAFNLWMKCSDITAKQYWLGQDYDTGLTVGFDGTSTNINFEVQVTGTGGHFIRQSTALLNTFASNDTWVNLGFSYDYNGGSPTFGMYADGVSVASQFRSWTDAVSAVGAGTGTFGIGDTPLAAGFDFAGNIAWLTIWNEAKTADQMAEVLYNPMAVPANAAAQWDCLTTAPVDLSGNGFDGTNSGASQSSDAPPVHLFSGGM